MRNRRLFSHSLPSSSFIRISQSSDCFRGANAAGWLEANLVAGALIVFADCAYHHQPDRQRCIHRFFAGRGLDKVCPSHHADQAGHPDIAQRGQFVRCQDGLHMRLATGRTKRLALHRTAPASFLQDKCPRNNDIDLACARLYRCSNLLSFCWNGILPGGKARRDRCHRNI